MTGTISRRRLLRTAGAGAVALGTAGLAAACGDDKKSGDNGGKKDVELSLVYMGTAEQAKVWNVLFDEFRKKEPTIRLKATNVPVDDWAAYFDKVQTQIAGGVTYDLTQVATEGLQLFSSKGLLHPLDDYITRDKAAVDEFLGDAHPNIVKWNKQYGSPDGKTYFLPGDFNTMGLWYNKDLFRKAGVPDPVDSWTWDDFLAAGRKIKSATGAFFYPASEAYFVCVMPWLLTNGASTLSADWKTATCDTPQAIEAATFVRQLVKEGISPAPGGASDAVTLAVQDKLATFGGGRWPIISVRNQKAASKFGIVAWPHKGAPNGSPIGWNTTPIMKGSKNKDAAWTFIKFLFSKEGAARFAKEGGTVVPARKSLASSSDYLNDSPAGTEKLYSALEYATVVPSPPKGNLVIKDIQDTWKRILAGEIEPAAGMKKMQEQVSRNV